MDVFLVVLFYLIEFVVLLCIITFFAVGAKNIIRSIRYEKYFYESDSDNDHLYSHRGMSKNLKTGKAKSTRSPLYK